MSEEPIGQDIDRPQHDSAVSRRGFLGSAVAAGGVTALGVRQASAEEQPSKGSEINPRLYACVGGTAGAWAVIKTTVITGEPLPEVKRVGVVNGAVPGLPDGAKWVLRGVTTNERYSTRVEKGQLAIQVALGRPEATNGALIPLRKNAKWWSLTQDERRAIFEDRSHHIKTGIKYLPAVARRLLHCRDLGEKEPFDFLTLFDFAKSAIPIFDEMMGELRASEEWKYIDREIDYRLVRDSA